MRIHPNIFHLVHTWKRSAPLSLGTGTLLVFFVMPFFIMPFVTGCSAKISSSQLLGEDSGSGPGQRMAGGESDSFQNKCDICAGCHSVHFKLWAYGGHGGLTCEVCHGPAGNHIVDDIDPRPKMRSRGDAEFCLTCHGRPKKRGGGGGIPLIENLDAHLKYIAEKHSVMIDVEKIEQKCTFCHDPHSLE